MAKTRNRRRGRRSPRPKVVDYTIVRLGGSLGVAGVGAGLMSANHFTIGLMVLYIGLVLFAVDIAYEEFFRRLGLFKRILGGCVYIIAIAVVSASWIFYPAPLQLAATSQVAAYGPGSKIDGIEWETRYSSLNVNLSNPSPVDYENFDAEVSTDLVIAEMKQISGLGGCSIAGVHPFVPAPHWQMMEGNTPVGPVDNPSVHYAMVPSGPDGNPIVPVAGGADWTYRIRCDRIPAKSHIEFSAALEVVNNPKDKPKELFGSPRAASWITLRSNFQTSGRKRSKLFSRCSLPCNST